MGVTVEIIGTPVDGDKGGRAALGGEGDREEIALGQLVVFTDPGGEGIPGEAAAPDG